MTQATARQALARFQVLLADLLTSSRSTLSAKASTMALSSVRVDGLLFLTSSIATPQNQKSRQLMSGDLAGQAMLVRSTWNHARACKAVANVSFEVTLKKSLRVLSIEISNFPIKSNLEMSEKIILSGKKV